MINPTEQDIGRRVIYRSHDGTKPEEGRISSLALGHVPPCVFVKFRGPTGELTRCDRLNWAIGFNRTRYSLAIVASKDAVARYRRMREAARFNPPRPATGGFPYYGGPRERRL